MSFKRVNISLDESTLKYIDTVAESLGISRSAFIALAANTFPLTDNVTKRQERTEDTIT